MKKPTSDGDKPLRSLYLQLGRVFGSYAVWGDGTPQYVGFFASTAHLEPEGVEELMIDLFDLRAIEPPAED